MYVDVCAHIGVNLDGVETVVSKVVVAQRQVDFAGNDGVSFLGVEANIEVGVFKNVNGLVGLNLSKANVTHANANAAFVVPALGIVVGFRIVIQSLAAIGLVGAPRCIRVVQANGVGGRDSCQRQIAGVHVAQQKRCKELLREGDGAANVK